MAALLDVSDVTLRYKTTSAVVTATERVSFTVDRSDRFVLLGPSGCGKSTLLKAVGGYMTPSEGKMRISGREISEPGADQWSKLDANTVQLGHPDAYVAMTNAQHEVRNHFAIPPFTFLELKNVPGAHVVLSSPDVMGGPLSQAQFFTTTKFADANPKIVQAVRDATKEAHDLIRSDTKAAVEIYKEVTGDKTSVEDLLAWLKEPGMMEWNLQPQGTMKFAAHLFKTGTLKTMPKAFTDYYLPVAHDLKGN